MRRKLRAFPAVAAAPLLIVIQKVRAGQPEQPPALHTAGGTRARLPATGKEHNGSEASLVEVRRVPSCETKGRTFSPRSGPSCFLIESPVYRVERSFEASAVCNSPSSTPVETQSTSVVVCPNARCARHTVLIVTFVPASCRTTMLNRPM